MNDRSGKGTGGFEVKIRTNTAKFTNMIIARFREEETVREERLQQVLSIVHDATEQSLVCVVRCFDTNLLVVVLG